MLQQHAIHLLNRFLALYGIARLCGWGMYALALPVLAWSSNQIFHQAYGSLAEIFAFSLFAAGFYLLLKPEAPSRRIAAEAGGVFLLAMAAALHMFSAVLVVLLFVPIVHARGERIPKFYWVLLLLFVVLCGQQFVRNPKSLFAGLNTHMEIPVFALTRSYFRPYQYREFVFITGLVLFLAWALFSRKSRSVLAWTLVLVYLALIAPLWVTIWDDSHYSGSFADRLPQVAPLILPFLLAILPAALPDFRWRNGLLVGAALFLFSQRFFFDLRTEALGPPMSVEALTRNRDLLKAWIPPEAPVKAIHGTQYRVSYILGNPSARVMKTKPDEVYFVLSNKGASGCWPMERLNEESIQKVDCVLLEQSWNIRRYDGKDS